MPPVGVLLLLELLERSEPEVGVTVTTALLIGLVAVTVIGTRAPEASRLEEVMVAVCSVCVESDAEEGALDEDGEEELWALLDWDVADVGAALLLSGSVAWDCDPASCCDEAEERDEAGAELWGEGKGEREGSGSDGVSLGFEP